MPAAPGPAARSTPGAASEDARSCRRCRPAKRVELGHGRRALHRAASADGQGARGVGVAQRCSTGMPARQAGDEGARRSSRRRRSDRPPRREGRRAMRSPARRSSSRPGRHASATIAGTPGPGARATRLVLVPPGSSDAARPAGQEEVGSAQHAARVRRRDLGQPRAAPCACWGRTRPRRRGLAPASIAARTGRHDPGDGQGRAHDMEVIGACEQAGCSCAVASSAATGANARCCRRSRGCRRRGSGRRRCRSAMPDGCAGWPRRRRRRAAAGRG